MNKVLFYQLKIEIRKFKTDEFMKSMCALSQNIRKHKGCLGYSVYQDSEIECNFSLVGEWKTRQAMEKHFLTHEFEVLIGAARVLGETVKMDIAEVTGTGGLKLARDQICRQ